MKANLCTTFMVLHSQCRGRGSRPSPPRAPCTRWCRRRSRPAAQSRAPRTRGSDLEWWIQQLVKVTYLMWMTAINKALGLAHFQQLIIGVTTWHWIYRRSAVKNAQNRELYKLMSTIMKAVKIYPKDGHVLSFMILWILSDNHGPKNWAPPPDLVFIHCIQCHRILLSTWWRWIHPIKTTSSPNT